MINNTGIYHAALAALAGGLLVRADEIKPDDLRPFEKSAKPTQSRQAARRLRQLANQAAKRGEQ
jgi:hypothetical protein